MHTNNNIIIKKAIATPLLDVRYDGQRAQGHDRPQIQPFRSHMDVMKMFHETDNIKIVKRQAVVKVIKEETMKQDFANQKSKFSDDLKRFTEDLKKINLTLYDENGALIGKKADMIKVSY